MKPYKLTEEERFKEEIDEFIGGFFASLTTRAFLWCKRGGKQEDFEKDQKFFIEFMTKQFEALLERRLKEQSRGIIKDLEDVQDMAFNDGQLYQKAAFNQDATEMYNIEGYLNHCVEELKQKYLSD